MNSRMKLSVDRRRPRGYHGDYWVSRETYKRMASHPHPLITVPPLIFTFHRGPGEWHVGHMEVSILGGVQLSLRYVLYTLLHFPPRPSPDPVLTHHARPCFYTQVSHITAEGWLCLSRGGRSVAGVDTNAYFSTQKSPSRLRTR